MYTSSCAILRRSSAWPTELPSWTRVPGTQPPVPRAARRPAQRPVTPGRVRRPTRDRKILHLTRTALPRPSPPIRTCSPCTGRDPSTRCTPWGTSPRGRPAPPLPNAGTTPTTRENTPWPTARATTTTGRPTTTRSPSARGRQRARSRSSAARPQMALPCIRKGRQLRQRRRYSNSPSTMVVVAIVVRVAVVMSVGWQTDPVMVPGYRPQIYPKTRPRWSQLITVSGRDACLCVDGPLFFACD